MTRRNLPTAAAILALAIFAGVGWWLLGGEGGSIVPATDPGGPVRPPSTADGGPVRTRERGSSRTGPAGPGARPEGPEVPAEGGAPAAAKTEEVREGIALLEGGRPLAGALIHQVSLESGPPMFASSAADGRFTVKPSQTEFAIRHPHARVVAVEGGTFREGETADLWAYVRVGDPKGNLRVVFRDAEGTAHVRLVDAVANSPLTNVAGLRLSYRFGPSLDGRAIYDYGGDPGLGGWIPIPENSLPEDLDLAVDPSGVVVEFHMPGYASKRIPLPDIQGRMEVRVEPVEPDARGEVVTKSKVVAMPESVSSDSRKISFMEPAVQATLRSANGDVLPEQLQRVLGLPARTGPFALYDLPDGAYEIEVATTVGNAVLRGRKRFERHGGTAEIGTIVIEGGAGVAVTVVDANGDTIPQAEVVVVRDGEDPEQGRRMLVPEGGSVAISDLEPGSSHRVVVFNLPRAVERPVVTPGQNETKELTIEWPDRLVACRIRLIVDGKAVSNPDGSTTVPATVHESPMPRGRGKWNTDGTFEARLVPGTYAFSVFAIPREGGEMALFSGTVTVPAGETFETTVELQRGR